MTAPLPIRDLAEKARRIRLSALEAGAASGKAHLGGTYSCTDLLVALYYGGILRIDPVRPDWGDRDRFILSKGHACLALYAILADLGMLSRERLGSYGADGGLGGQLDTSIPGVDWNTGSLGHALGVCAGMALAAKLDGRGYRAFTILGDAECAEGSIWEALIFAADFRLDNLIAIIDRNRLSVTDVLDDDSFFQDFGDKVRAFGWDFAEIDGHAFPEILSALGRTGAGARPLMVVANTIKGKGVSFMENELKWHHGVPSEDELRRAVAELSRPA